MIEVKEVSEVIATLEVIDDTLASDVCGRTNVVNSANFDNFVNFKKKQEYNEEAKISETRNGGSEDSALADAVRQHYKC